MLQPIETHIQNITGAPKKELLRSILSNPKKFVEEATNLDPSAVHPIIELLDDLLVISEGTLHGLVEDLDKETAELDRTKKELSNAEDAVIDAGREVDAAEKKVVEADVVVDEKKVILGEKKRIEGDAEEAHEKKLEEKRIANEEYNNLKPGLDTEQTVLDQVMKKLGEFRDVRNYEFMGHGRCTSDGEQTKASIYVDINDLSICENKCEQIGPDCIGFQYLAQHSHCWMYGGAFSGRVNLFDGPTTPITSFKATSTDEYCYRRKGEEVEVEEVEEEAIYVTASSYGKGCEEDGLVSIPSKDECSKAGEELYSKQVSHEVKNGNCGYGFVGCVYRKDDVVQYEHNLDHIKTSSCKWRTDRLAICKR